MSEIIKGKLVSSKGVSVSRAATLISRFAAVENGSSPTVSLYLQQAAESFNQLVQFHLETQSNPTISRNINGYKALKSSEDQNNNKKRKNHKSDGDEVDFKNKKNKKKKKTVIDS